MMSNEFRCVNGLDFQDLDSDSSFSFDLDKPLSPCQPISPKLVRHHRLGPDDPSNKIAGNPLLRRAAGKALQDLLDAVPVNEDWG